MNTRYLTIVYKYLSPQRTEELIKQSDVVAMAHSHKMDEVNELREQLNNLKLHRINQPTGE